MTNIEAKQKLIEAGVIVMEAGLDDFTRGHISVRDPGNPDRFFMKPHSYGLEEITTENIVVCALSGEKIEGGGRRHSEVFIHSEILKARPDINAVLHVHPKHATAFSATGRKLRFLSLPSTEFADGLGIFDETRDLIQTPQLGASVASALGSGRAVLLRNHGVVVAGRTIEECVILTLSLENACEIQLMVESSGTEMTEIPAHEIKTLQSKMMAPEQYQLNFDYLVRKSRRP